MKLKPEQVRKGLAIFLLGGILVFLVSLCSLIGAILVFPRVLITYEYAREVHPFALAVALCVGLSFIGGSFLLRENRRKKPGRRDRLLFLAFLFIALPVGWMTYKGIGSASATILHARSEQETVELTASADSAWPANRDLPNCSHHLSFGQPRISPDSQYVCIDHSQWMFFRDAELPIQVVLYGTRSYYGYELHCCR